LWNAYDDMTNFQRNFSTGEVEIEGSVIYHKTEYRERRNHYAFYSVNAKISGFDSDRDSFIGLYNGFDAPWAPIASHSIEIELNPGEQKEYVFIIGYVENVINKKKAYEMIEQFNTVEKVDKAFEELKSYWNALLSKYFLESHDEKWLHSTCQEALHTLNPVSEEVWVSEIQTRTCWDLYTRYPKEQEKGFLTWLQLSLKMAVRTISISLLPKNRCG